MSDTYITPAEVLEQLHGIALQAAAEYDERLKALPADAKTEKKALTIQREMATLYIRAIMPGYGKTPNHALLDFMERRIRQEAANPFPAVPALYDATPAEDRPLLLPYLLGLSFIESQFLRPWRAEADTAAAGDVVAAFELKLKIATVSDVLARGEAWWQATAAEGRLPILPTAEELLHG